MKIEEKTYSVFQNILFLIRESRELDKRILSFTAIAIVTGVMMPVFGIYLPKTAVDLLARRAGIREIAAVMGGLVAFMLVIYGVGGIF